MADRLRKAVGFGERCQLLTLSLDREGLASVQSLPPDLQELVAVGTFDDVGVPRTEDLAVDVEGVLARLVLDPEVIAERQQPFRTRYVLMTSDSVAGGRWASGFTRVRCPGTGRRPRKGTRAIGTLARPTEYLLAVDRFA